MFSSRTTESKTILMNYSCLALVLKSKPRLKPRRYTDGTSRVLPFPIPLLLVGPRLLLLTKVLFLLIVSPLVSLIMRLMIDQVRSLNNRGVSAAILSSNKGIDKDLVGVFWEVFPAVYCPRGCC